MSGQVKDQKELPTVRNTLHQKILVCGRPQQTGKGAMNKAGTLLGAGTRIYLNLFKF